MKLVIQTIQIFKPLAITLLILITSPSYAQKIPVSVTQFEDNSGSSNCRYGWDSYWHRYLGNGFKEMLISELKKNPGIAIYERETIKKIYGDEHELLNSAEDTTIKKNKFKKAKYTFVGAVTEFEYCAAEKGASLNVGSVARAFGFGYVPDIDVGKSGATAKLSIDVRVIDVTTGEIVDTISTTSEVNDSKFSIDSGNFNYKDQSSSPMGKAAREAIAKAAKQLVTTIQ